MPFKALGLHPHLVQATREMGYTEPTPIQAEAIPHVLAGRDLIATAQTGTGKTAAFLLPILHQLMQKPHGTSQALIVTPTRELAQQIDDVCSGLAYHTGLRVGLIVGGTAMGPQEKALRAGVELLVATPGRLLDHFERGKLMLSQVNILVIDEADRMLDMGFIPDVERICKLIPFTRQTLFYSATMPPEIQRLTEQFLHNPVRVEVSRPATAATTIEQNIVKVPANDWAKREALRRLIREAEPTLNNALIFCNRKRDVDVVAKSLAKHGFNVAPLHGDLDQSLRTKTLDSFRAGELKILVASDVAARGLDIPVVSHVFNFDVPFHADDYVHRIGRTGRAGRVGYAYMLATPRDEKQVDAIERLTKTTIPRQTMENLEVREDRKPRRDADRSRGRNDRNRKDKFRPDKFHDHVAPMEPAPAIAEAVAPAVHETAVVHAPEPAVARSEHRPEKKHEPRREQHRPPQKKRDPEHRASHDRKHDATPVKPEKHQLPAFLFRPVPLPKKADAEG